MDFAHEHPDIPFHLKSFAIAFVIPYSLNTMLLDGFALDLFNLMSIASFTY